MGLDMGDDTVEVLKKEDFFSQVLTDLNLLYLTDDLNKDNKLDQFFA